MNFFSTGPPKDEDDVKMDEVAEKVASTPSLTKDEVRNSNVQNRHPNNHYL
jgi:hypothetical protein